MKKAKLNNNKKNVGIELKNLTENQFHMWYNNMWSHTY